MVIDNTDDTQMFFGLAEAEGEEGNLGRYLPDCAHGAILVTTRNM